MSLKTAALVSLVVATASLGACDRLPFFRVTSPARKPGLWEQSMQTDRSPSPIVTKWCFDQASDRRMPVLPKGPRRAGFCSRFHIARNGGAYTVDSVCGFGGTAITAHAIISGDYSSKYTIVSTVDIAGSSNPARNGRHKTTITMTYLGPDCGTDLGPGQMERPDGTVVDMAQLRGGGFGGGHGPAARRGPGASGGPPANSVSNSAAP